MTTPRQWLSYWKKSLLDSAKTEIDPNNYAETIRIPFFSIHTDELADAEAVKRLIDAEEKRVNKKRRIDSPDDPRWQPLDEVQVWIAPFRLNPLPQRQTFVKERKPLYPFWYPARLDRNGRLGIPDEPLPFIPRIYLAPIVDERFEYTIGDTETTDRAYAGCGDYKNYTDYIDHIGQLFEQIAGTSLPDYCHPDYATDYTAHLLVPDETIGAARHLIGLYENLLVSDTVPPLLRKLATLDHEAPRPPLEPKDWLPANELHLGQMKAAFPLSYSQRKSLYTLLANPGEPVMAVNGPPGTGKTTLLQSVVANAMVKSVLNGRPDVILACSANNQAVTNIIDSFTKKDDNEPEIRWLPGLTGYATYLPSASKPAEALRNINYMKPDGEGLFARLETREYLQQAQKEYLKQGEVCFGERFPAVGPLVERLRERIVSAGRRLKEARTLWTACLEAQAEMEREYRPCLSCAGSYVTKEGLLPAAVLEQDIAQLEELTEKTLAYFRHEPVLRKIGCWLKIGSSLKNRRAELNVVFRRSPLRPESLPERIPGPAEVLTGIDRLIKLAAQCLQRIRDWGQWQEKMEREWPDCVKKSPGFFRQQPLDDATAFYDALDTTLRYRTFVDAVRYWEGRWIEETAIFLGRPPAEQRKRGEEASHARWRRRAMLTPCFVSTFYMAPRFFNYARYLGKDGEGRSVFENAPSAGFIDCLIVDEAGQVPPEVGAAVFALASQAVVVGDVKQIEPVWSILPKVDLGNLKKEGLLGSDEKTAEDIYQPKGFLSSCGSLMQLAQNACGFAERHGAERGTMLVEHRRCYNEIIGYCNELAYHGLLRPLRGMAKPGNLYPPMSCIHVDGHSTVENKDRYNDIECQAICRWLAQQKATIENRYVDGKDYHCVEDIVGILTPFVGQKKRIRQALKQAGFQADRFKLGTVHALQGAERPIVLFSAVYGPGDAGTLFFDAGNKPNMLNVAVSRAKDCFIVFANTRIFNPAADTPSGILARHLGCTQQKN